VPWYCYRCERIFPFADVADFGACPTCGDGFIVSMDGDVESGDDDAMGNVHLADSISSNSGEQQQQAHEVDEIMAMFRRLHAEAAPQQQTQQQHRHIVQLKNVKFSEENGETQCVTCLELFKCGKHVVQLKCKHIFHKPCIVPWLDDNNTCPICRAKVDPKRKMAREPRASSPPQFPLSIFRELLNIDSGDDNDGDEASPSQAASSLGRWRDAQVDVSAQRERGPIVRPMPAPGSGDGDSSFCRLQ